MSAPFRLTLDRPCPLQLGEMPDKNNHKWFCSQCKESVYDLSSMGPKRAAALLQQRAHSGQETCGEWYADSTGRVLFNVTRAAAAAAAVLIASPALADGNDLVIPDAIEFLLGDAGIANRDAHQATSAPGDAEQEHDAAQVGGDETVVEPVRHFRGRVRYPRTPRPAVTPSPNGTP